MLPDIQPGSKHLCGGFVYRAAVYQRHAAGISPQQGPSTQQIDAARYAARELVDSDQSLFIKGRCACQARHRQPVGDVVAGFKLRQGVQVKPRNHALRQLLQLWAGQYAAKLGLADQHDLQQLALAGFQIGQQPQLLQHVGRQVLCLVNDQYIVLARSVPSQQKTVQGINKVLGSDCARGQGDVKFVANRT